MRRFPFLALAVGQAVSGLGSMLTSVVLQWTLWSQYQAGTMHALLRAATALPYILLGPWAGALVDRWDSPACWGGSSG